MLNLLRALTFTPAPRSLTHGSLRAFSESITNSFKSRSKLTEFYKFTHPDVLSNAPVIPSSPTFLLTHPNRKKSRKRISAQSRSSTPTSIPSTRTLVSPSKASSSTSRTSPQTKTGNSISSKVTPYPPPPRYSPSNSNADPVEARCWH